MKKPHVFKSRRYDGLWTVLLPGGGKVRFHSWQEAVAHSLVWSEAQSKPKPKGIMSLLFKRGA